MTKPSLLMKLLGGGMIGAAPMLIPLFLMGLAFCSNHESQSAELFCQIKNGGLGALVVLSYFISGLGFLLGRKIAWLIVIPTILFLLATFGGFVFLFVFLIHVLVIYYLYTKRMLLR